MSIVSGRHFWLTVQLRNMRVHGGTVSATTSNPADDFREGHGQIVSVHKLSSAYGVKDAAMSNRDATGVYISGTYQQHCPAPHARIETSTLGFSLDSRPYSD